MKSKKQALAKSVLALLLCVAMLVGTTFAWFTDSVVSGINTITAGNLDVELYHSNAAVSDKKVNANTELFLDLNGADILWEPGVVSYENLTVANEGDLALVYQLVINTANENYIVDGANQYGLSQALKVGVVEGGVTATDRQGVIGSVSSWTTLGSFLADGALLPEGSETVGIVIYWQPGDNDNNWNLNNGKTLNEGTALNIDLGVNLTATQAEHESDVFGTDYDVIAADDVFPEFNGGTGGVGVTVDANNRTTEAVSLTAGDVTVTVPAGVLVNPGVTKLTATISDVNASEANITLEDTEAVRSLDVHVEGVSAENDVPLTVAMPEAAPVALNMGNYSLYHVEDGNTNEMTLVTEFTAHNQYKYDPATGDIVLYMATFSEVAMVADTVNAWEGEFDYTWYEGKSSPYSIANADQLAAFGAIVGNMKKVTGMSNGRYTYADALEKHSFSGETVNLVNDIYIGDLDSENGIVLYPVGYWNNEGTYEKSTATATEAVSSGFYAFMGTFDGQGHTVSHFYQNTWEMKGDHNWYNPITEQHFRDGMGLFGKVYNGTVKNLTVDNFSSDGEITTTGVIAAYADGGTFENIAITNCNPRVYNIGNGGIVGCVGWYAEDAGLKTTFTNITVDNTNKISALWGSWDVACGGIVGQYYPTSGQTDAGTPKNGGVHFDNCHVSAQIDVYNDVCANYQYYAYRYAGMLMGSVRENETIDGREYPKMEGITANNCTVHFGDWNDYYYCELVANSLASYTHDHQMSRLEQVAAVNGTTITPLEGQSYTVPSSGRYNYVVVNAKKADGKFDHATENAECFHFVDGVAWSHETEGYEDVDENGDGLTEHVRKEDKQHIYLEFNNLITGYGWGVTSKGVEDMDGVRILDREEGNSVVKFESKIDALLTGNTYKLGDIFSFVDNGVEVKDGSFTVTVTNLADNNPVSYVITRSDNWEETALALSGVGTVTITVQDYHFCVPTSITVDVKNTVPVPGITNPIANGTFESSNISAWTNKVYAGNRVVTPIAAYTGASGLSVTGEGNWGGLLNQTFSVENGKDYVLVFWYKVNNQGFSWTLKGANSGTEYKNSWVNGNDNSWKKASVEFTATNDSAVILNFSSNNGDGKIEQFFLDDIFLVEKNLISNNGFEFGTDGWHLSSNAQLVNNGTNSGNYAVQINNPEKAWKEDLTQTFAVERNQAYMITFNVKLVSGDGRYYALAYGKNTSSNLEYLYNNPWFSCSSSWKEKMIIVDSGNNDSIMLKFTAELDNYESGTIMIDDVKAYKINYNGILLDGDMETGLAYEWLGSSSNGYSYGLSTEEVHGGKYSMKAVGNGSWGGMAWRYFTTEAGKSYTLTAWVKVTTGGVSISMNDYSSGLWNAVALEGVDKQTKKASDNSEWQLITFTFTAKSTRTGISFGGTGGEDANPNNIGTIYIDDMVLVQN